jgi:3-oxoacyl-[acyl-carrier-protein] synthase II
LLAGLTDVDWVCGHGTATPLNDPMESRVLAELLPGVPVSSIKGAIGHTLGAAGAIELVQTVLAVQQGRIPVNSGGGAGIGCRVATETLRQPLRGALSVNFAFGGHNTAVRILAC